MTWFRVDDGLPHHPKILSIPKRDRPAAMGLWVLAGAWSAANLTDGLIPEYLPEHLGCPKRLAQVLSNAGLWSAEGRAWRFHDWADLQPSREKVSANRRENREKVQAWRDRQKEKRRSEGVRNQDGNQGVTGYVTEGVPLSRPDPTRPDPTPLPTEEEEGHSTAVESATDIEFESWWKEYPRKTAKGAAVKAYAKALTKTDAPTLLAAVKAQTFSEEAKFIPHPATWLNQERWNDQRPTPAQATPKTPAGYDSRGGITWDRIPSQALVDLARASGDDELADRRQRELDAYHARLQDLRAKRAAS